MVLASLGTLLQTLIGFVIAVLILPSMALGGRSDEGALVRLSSVLVAGVAFWTAVTFTLTLARSVELATMVAAAVIGVAVIRTRGRRPATRDERAAGATKASRFWDVLDPGSGHGLLWFIWTYLAELVSAVRRALLGLRQPLVLGSVVAILITFGWHLWGPLNQVAPGTAEGYVDLLAVKEIALNQGPFAVGLFPEGLHVLVAALSTLFLNNSLLVFRFWGALTAVMIVLGAMALAWEISGGSLWAIFTTAVMVGLTTLPTAGGVPWHLTTPIAVKMGLAFLLFGLAFALRWLRDGERRDRMIMISAAVVVTLVEPLLVPYLLAGVVMLALSWASLVAGTWKRAISAVFVTLVAIAASLIPIAGGLLLKVAPLTILWTMRIPYLPPTGLTMWLTGPRAPLLIGAVVAGLLVQTILAFRNSRSWSAVTLGMALAIASCWGLTKLGPIGLYDVGGAGLAADVVGALLITTFFGWAYMGALKLQENRAVAVILALVTLAPGLYLAPLKPQPLHRFEAVGSGQVYLRVSTTFPAYTWTLISPTQQYSEVLGTGWHVELITFVGSALLAQAKNRDFRPKDARHLAILTPDIFLDIPLKVPGFPHPITVQDASLKLPVGGGSLVYTGTAGAAVSGRALVWGLAYLKSHPKTASVYFHSSQLLVIWIQQP